MAAIGETSAEATRSNSESEVVPLIWEERGRYINKLLPLYKAALKGDWVAAAKIIDEDPGTVHANITRGRLTVLHVAAGAGHDHFVEQLMIMNSFTIDVLRHRDAKGNTALCFAVASGNISMAKRMIEKDSTLLQIRGGEGMTTLYVATLFGHKEMASYLYPLLKKEIDCDIGERNGIFFTCIKNDLYELALKMLDDYKELAVARDVRGETALHLLARKPSVFAIESRGIWKRMPDYFGKKKRKYFICTAGLQLLKSIWEIVVWQNEFMINKIIREPSNVLFLATKAGNFDFVAELVDSYPELIWETDEQNRNLFHIAVLHHDISFLNLLHKFALFKDLVVSFKDKDDNNILHLAASLGPPHQFSNVSGPALQLQLELSWFEELKRIAPPFYLEMKNVDDQTPRDIFTEQHRSLLDKGEWWMKNVASLGTLVSTFMFASVLSGEGGNTLLTGAKQTPLSISVISDCLALFFCSIAILAFLSIFLSRFSEEDFLDALPLKLLIGLIALFLSTAAITVSFGTFLCIAFRDRLKWLPALNFAFANLLFYGFFYLHYHLLSHLLASTCYSRFLFRPTKRMVLATVRACFLPILLFWFIPHYMLL